MHGDLLARLTTDARARWLDVERLAEEVNDPDLNSWVEQTMLAMLAVRDRLEQLAAIEALEEVVA
jgi:Mn-containing catalase